MYCFQKTQYIKIQYNKISVCPENTNIKNALCPENTKHQKILSIENALCPENTKHQKHKTSKMHCVQKNFIYHTVLKVFCRPVNVKPLENKE